MTANASTPHVDRDPTDVEASTTATSNISPIFSANARVSLSSDGLPSTLKQQRITTTTLTTLDQRNKRKVGDTKSTKKTTTTTTLMAQATSRRQDEDYYLRLQQRTNNERQPTPQGQYSRGTAT
jgi:hypothetical protein